MTEILTKLENPKPSARADSDSLEVSGLLTFVSGCILEEYILKWLNGQTIIFGNNTKYRVVYIVFLKRNKIRPNYVLADFSVSKQWFYVNMDWTSCSKNILYNAAVSWYLKTLY